MISNPWRGVIPKNTIIINAGIGRSLNSVIESITDASATNRYLILLSPGDHTITRSLALPSTGSDPDRIMNIDFVTIQGCGMGITRVLANTDISMIYPGEEFYLKDLTFENTNAGYSYVIRSAWWCNAFGMNAERVHFKSAFKMDTGSNTTNWLSHTYIDCVFECGDDQFWIGSTKVPDSGIAVYTFINPICHFEVNNARIFYSNKYSYTKCMAYNPIMTGVTTQDSCRPFKLTDGEIHVFNPYIDIGSALDTNCHGVMVRDGATGGKLNVYGGTIKTTGNIGVWNHHTSLGALNLFGTEYETSAGIIGGDHKINDESAAGTYTLNSSGVTKLDSSAGAITGTVGDGSYIGQRKHIVMTDATNSSTVSVTNHETSDPEVGTFNAVDEVWILEWSGSEWVTIKASCTF